MFDTASDSFDLEIAPYTSGMSNDASDWAQRRAESDRTELGLNRETPAQDMTPGLMNDTARILGEAESATLTDHGIGGSTQFYATGTNLGHDGHATLEAMDAVYKRLPPPSTAVADFHAKIDSEARTDHFVDVADMRLSVVGRLVPKADACSVLSGFRVEDVPYRQLAAIAGQPNINAGLTGHSKATRRMRTRTVSGDLSTYALVSADLKRGYTVCDGGEVADMALAGLRDAGMLSGAKTELTYDATTTRYKMRTIVQAPIDIPAFRGVGRVHQIFMDVSGGDDGMASVRGAMGAIRIRCMNCTLSQANGMEWSRIHKGDMSDVRRLVAGMSTKFKALADDMIAVWTNAAANYYLDAGGGRLSPSEAIARLIAHKYIPTGDMTDEAAADAYLSAWRAEDSPESAAGIVMAIQRAAHEVTWASKWATTEIEESASQLLYQSNYTLPEIRT